MTFKISLGMIVKNEGQTLAQCLLSVAPHVDEIVIGLGGKSTDNTEKIIQEFISKGVPITVFPIEWTNDFSAARNQVLDRVTGDYFLWVDGDDVLVGAEKLRQQVVSNPNIDAFYMGYDYARDEGGNCVCYLIRERLVRLQDELPDKGWRWIGPIHEVLAPQGFVPDGKMVDGIVVMHHKPPNKHEADRNIKILYQQLEASEPNPDARILGYLCTENMGRGNLHEAVLHGQRFVKLSGWDEERYQMQHRVADMHRVMGNYQKALIADMSAITIKPEWPDAWYGMAETYLALENAAAAIEYTKNGASKQSPQTMLIINPLDYSFYPAVILAGAYARLNDHEMALANYQKAFEIQPRQDIADLITMLQREVHLASVVNNFLALREHLGRNDEWLKVRKLYDALPKQIQQHPAIMETWERTMLQTGHVDNPQIMTDFYTGNPHWESMDEEMILSDEWKKYPRFKFAMDTARRIGAKNVVDWGCSDGFIGLPLALDLGIHVTGFDLDPRCTQLATDRALRWKADARFEVGNVDEIGAWEGEKADLAIFFEVIEHVVDPAATLTRLEKTAKHIIMTTPYLSWEGGNVTAWDRLEPKGHLRIFDQYDLEKLMAPRGKIHNLYRQPWANRGWLFAEYEPGITQDKTIIFGAMGSPEAWNPRTLTASGLGGSETAVIKVAEAFSKQGHRAIVYSSVDEPGYYDGVCYRDQTHFRSQIESDLFIAWRWPEAADLPINTKRLVLWLHDTDAGDRLTEARASKFTAIVVLTEWHKQHVLKTYPFLKADRIFVIGNGVDLCRFDEQVERNPNRVIYSSSPDRGLDVILEHIWPKVLEEVPEAELHVYYGWNNIDKFTPMYPHLQEFKHKVMSLMVNSKNVTQHGRVDQAVLAKEFQRSSLWLYPTYFTETYCITAVEAQLAGAIPITNHLAGLAETVKSGVIIDGDVHDSEVQAKYIKATVTLLQQPMKERRAIHKKVSQHAPAISWDRVAELWAEQFLQETLQWQTFSTMSDETTSSADQSTGLRVLSASDL
jgi:glycosyltransferase involved in cell wall biosynthesis